MERQYQQPSRHAAAGAPPAQRAPRHATALERIVQRSVRVAEQGSMAQLVDASPRMRARGQICQLVQQSPRMVAQRQEDSAAPSSSGLPDSLRSGIHQLSGIDLGAARVHRNSAAPGRIGAHAFAQAGQIHLGPGQERHLPHEAWHLVQQAQGRVRQTVQAKGIAVNDDTALENEADRMGARAETLGRGSSPALPMQAQGLPRRPAPVAQAFWLRREGQPEWINNARKVDALLVPEDGTPQTEASGPGTAFENSHAGGIVYRLSGQVQVPWQELSRLITLLGAARMQAIYVRQYPLWGTEEGVAALGAQLDNLARLDLSVFQALFAQPATDVSHLLKTASSADFRRLFNGKREQQLDLVRSGAFRTVTLPLPPEEKKAPSASHGQQEQEPQQGDGAASSVPANPSEKRAAIQAAVAERVTDKRDAARRGNPAQWLDALAQQWSSTRVAANVAEADAAQAHNAAALAGISLPGVPGGIFHQTQERVRTALTQGPYETADVVVERRAGTARIGGDYTDPQGRKHRGAVHGRFTGYLSGMAGGPQPIASMMAAGSGDAVAELQARTEAGGRLGGTLSGTIGLRSAFLTLEAERAHFEGGGELHTRMDAPLERTLTHWQQRPDSAGIEANAGRQILSDGAHNRALLRPETLHAHGSGAGQHLAARLHGSSQGWNHPVKNSGRYSGLTAELHAPDTGTAGSFRPDSLHQIVRHAGAAGTPRRYVRAPEAPHGGPQSLDGALLASSIDLAGSLDQLVAAGQLPAAAARLAQLQYATTAPEFKPASSAPDIALASAPKPGSNYSVSVDRKKYEFRLEALALPAHWSEGRFRYRFRLDHRAVARYLPQT